MPKKVPELSANEIRTLTKPGLHSAGGVSGLMVKVSPSISRSWILRTVIGGKRRDIGLGGHPDVGLAQAREKARAIKDQIKQGIDPILQRQLAKSALISEQSRSVTFKDLADVYIQRKGKEFKTAKQKQKLEGHINTYALPFIGNLLVSDIEMSHIVKMLTPIWEKKTETATRVRLHVEKILDIAIADKKRSEVNPAKWKGMLEHSSLPMPGKVSKVKHYNALPVDELPAFWQKLKGADGMGARALRLIILTAARSGEVRGATWDEIDLAKKIWTIPAERMKTAKAHVVPLSNEAIDLLQSTPRLGKYVITGARGGQISDVMVSKVPKTLGHDVTAHGFRSTFKDWTRLHTKYPDEVSELALAHVNDDRTRAAYARDGLLDKRRRLMADWARYCEHGAPAQQAGNVVAIGGGRV